MNKRITQLACSFVCELAIAFAFTSSSSLKTCCSSTWLHVMIASITLTTTWLGLGFFVITMAIIFGLIENMFWISNFLGQSNAQCLELEQIIQIYVIYTKFKIKKVALTS